MDNPEPQPMRSVHTASMPELLGHLGASLLVSTYQAGKLVVLRADGAMLNTHFRAFRRPMGLAVRGGRLAVGIAAVVMEFHDIPAVAAKLSPAGKHDACFMPRLSHVTGDIAVHEMAYAGDELVFVNTLFSCLCVRSDTYSFRPVWRPAFVSALAPEDRCHLNGLGMRDGRARYVTALGETDSPAGWRANKRDGGVLIDVATGEVLLRGLSMPHSPRWHGGRLWLLQSGNGGLGYFDETARRYVELVTLPGFTRGLDFVGRYAFVGLSQVRETAVFGGIPITEQVRERNCGVWAVDLEAGEVVGFVKFEDAVQEVFAVAALPGMRFPDLINDDDELLARSYVLPDDALTEVPASMRG